MVWSLVVSTPCLCPLSYFVTVSVLLLFLTVPWVGLQCVVAVFPDHTHLCFFIVGETVHFTWALQKQVHYNIKLYFFHKIINKNV